MDAGVGTSVAIGRYGHAMPGCRKFDASSLPSNPPRRIELRRYIQRNVRAPRAANDNRRTGSARRWYWIAAVGAMPTIGLLAMLSTLL